MVARRKKSITPNPTNPSRRRRTNRNPRQGGGVPHRSNQNRNRSNLNEEW